MVVMADEGVGDAAHDTPMSIQTQHADWVSLNETTCMFYYKIY